VENKIDLPYLLQGHRAGTLSDAEKLQLFHMLEDRDTLSRWESLIEKVYEDASSSSATTNQDANLEEMIQYILHHPAESGTPAPTPVRRLLPPWLKYAAAAAVISLVASIYLLRRPAVPPPASKDISIKNDVLPGGNHAVLTLANGKQIILDSIGSGSLGMQGSARVTKIDAGSLSYQSTTGDPSKVFYNAIATPAGGQYQVTLADGTVVWLNALSSLKFPTSFNGRERSVEVTGEAYFEVAKDPSRPFIVHVNDAAVEVYGTHFDIMAYHNEGALETTLLEGSIRFRNAGKDVLLKPGQQSRLLPDKQIQLLNDVNLDQVVAWKNGMQSFNSADILTIMRQVERWYDIQVEYKGNITARKFSGDIPREAKLSELLNMFKVNKIHFEIDAAHKKMIVMP